MYELSDSQAEELGRRGYVYVPNFLGEADLEMLREDFKNALVKDPKNDYFRRASRDVLVKFLPHFLEMGKTIHRVAGIEVDGIYGGGAYFANYTARPDAKQKSKSRGVALGWHQDHDSYYMYQDHYNYLNFYIPFEKPDPTRSNLTIVPFDKLQAKAPELYEKMLRRGATRAKTASGSVTILDDERGGRLGRINCDISEIEETPDLKPGDLLLLRGDILHRTQDTSTKRVAASFRMMNGNSTISRKQLAKGGLVKAFLMYGRRGEYRALFQLFDLKGRDTVTVGEYIKHMDELKKRQLVKSRPAAFIYRLLKEKIRSIF